MEDIWACLIFQAERFNSQGPEKKWRNKILLN